MQNIAKKIIPYLFILITLIGIGFFSWAGEVTAEDPPKGTCSNIPPPHTPSTETNTTQGWCTGFNGTWVKNPAGTPPDEPPPTTGDSPGTCNISKFKTPASCEAEGGKWTSTKEEGPKTPFDEAVGEWSCGIGPGSSLLPGCLVKFLYYMMYVFPSLLLAVVAYFFNVLISVTLGSTLLKSGFISEAWGVVRDLSNIFFILILLYISIKIILDIGGHEAKQMIKNVIIIALLINFSMFFTHIVIDTSNVLALVFYNKLSTGNKDPITGKIVSAPYQAITGEKDISGGLVSAFNPTSALGPTFFTAAKAPIQLPGEAPNTTPEDKVPAGMLIGIIITTGAIFLVAIYALFISGLAFLGRLIELFILIIFSPFAFMSFVVPKLAHVEYLGWDDWLKRLISVSFMAPIFMFFMYFIFMLVKAKMYDDMLKSGDGIIIALLRMIIPALFVLILLLKATEYAKKGSGKFGEVVMNGAKLVSGFALGAATGGIALAGSQVLGGTSNAILKKSGDSLKLKSTEKGMGGYAAKLALKTMNYGANASFDIRKSPIGTLAAKGGLNLDKGTNLFRVGGKDTDGGFKGREERKAKKFEAEKDSLRTKMSDTEVRAWSENKRKEWENSGRKGPEPKLYKSAYELDADKLKNFAANIGKTGLMHSVAYSAAKKYVDKNPIENETAEKKEERIEKIALGIKVAIGTVGALGAVAVAPGAAIGAIKGAASAVSAGTAAAGALGMGSTTSAILGGGSVLAAGAGLASGITGVSFDNSKGAAQKNLGKEVKKLEKAASKTTKLEEEKKEVEELMKEIEKEIPNGGNYTNYIKEKLKTIESELEGYKSEEEEARGSITAYKTAKATAVASGKTIDPNIDIKIKEFETQLREARTKTFEKTVEKAKYTEGKNAVEKLSKIEKQLHDTEDSVKAKHTEKKGTEIPTPAGGGSKAHAETHEEHSKESGGGHDAGGGGGGHDAHPKAH